LKSISLPPEVAVMTLEVRFSNLGISWMASVSSSCFFFAAVVSVLLVRTVVGTSLSLLARIILPLLLII